MKSLICLAAGTCLLLFACRKQDISITGSPNTLVAEAHSFFASHISGQSPVYLAGNPQDARTTSQKSVDWDKAGTTTFKGHAAVIAPLRYTGTSYVTALTKSYYNLQDLQRLLMYKDSTAAWHTEVVTFLPDSDYVKSAGKVVTGGVVAEDWWGNPLQKLHYRKDGKIYQYTQDGAIAAQPAKAAQQANPQGLAQSDVIIVICNYLDGYNFAPSDPENGVYWEENLGCYEAYFGDFIPGDPGDGYIYVVAPPVGGGGGSAVAPSNVPAVNPPDNIIGNLADYLACYQGVAGANYSVSICVDQPAPGTRQPWTFSSGSGTSAGGNPINVGHTFIILREQKPDGSMIQRNIGFYPAVSTSPFSAPVPSVFNDDETHPFDISGTFTVTWQGFSSMLDYISSVQQAPYQINSFNCTNFGLGVLQAAGIDMPHTYGTWIGGAGVDPGDLGEDIRDFNQAIPGMLMTVGEQAHPNVGICN